MTFLLPQALVLLVPLAVVLWRRGWVQGPAMWLRVALLLIITLALARPSWRVRSAGSDVVVVVDRSKSMPERSEGSAIELVRLLEDQRGDGDRVGVIAFGRQARTQRALSHDAVFGGFTNPVDDEASNLSAALDAAYDLIPSDRTGRVLIISDGRATGVDARTAARRLASRGIQVDHRWLGREQATLDVAVTSVEGPPSLPANEPFLLTATVHSNVATKGVFTLLRNGQPLVKVARDIPQGSSIVTFPDLADRPGLIGYEVRVSVEGDRVIENDVGRAVIRVDASPHVLLLTDKPNGTMAKTLRDAKLEVDVRAPGPVAMADLENVGTVVLEDVEAGLLTESGLSVLAQYVTVAGGGLVMTGGRHSFGEGGYRKSAVETVLPVSLEIRQEQRKAAIALSIIMDCSCSMGVTVPDGRTKMELAAEGVVGALQLLNANDEASVHMVDTGDHVLFGLTPVSDGLPLDKVSRGFSGGGGIYVGVGMRVAKDEILKSTKATRHVLLFSDAADSEQPDDAEHTVDTLVSKGVTVSVIGMGSPSDPDAQLLKDIANRGHGRIYFAEDVTGLPRIFSQETIAVARASFIDEPTSLSVSADLELLGRIALSGSSPRTNGYNLTFRKPNASVGLSTSDDNQAPAVAFWPSGAGRTVAITLEVDGSSTGPFRDWPSSRAMLEQAVRWSMAAQVEALDAVARTSLQGNDLHVTLDLGPEAVASVNAPMLVLMSSDARVKPIELPLRWEESDRLGAHVALPGSGTWHPVLKTSNRVFRAAPATLSWAPEFEPGTAKEGRLTLAALSKAGDGVERLSMTSMFKEALESEGAVPLSAPLVAIAIALLVAEIFTRRFWAGPSRVKPLPKATQPAPPAPSEPVAAAPAAQEMTDALLAARKRSRSRTEK